MTRQSSSTENLDSVPLSARLYDASRPTNEATNTATVPDVALEIARRIAEGLRIDWSEIEQRDPALARGLSKLGKIAEAMQVSARTDQDSTDQASTGQNWGHLQQLSLAGVGGFGEVFRAYDPSLDRIVALKLRRADTISELTSGRDFVAEARRLARVRHPHVLAVHGASYHQGRAGLWTDWIEGETLSHHLEHNDAIASVELIRLLIELTDAIQAVHNAGLVHGDIKASNVMLDTERRVVLMDFGAGFESSAQGVLMQSGTLKYLAPEVLDAQPATQAVDFYALGVLAHLLACKQFPEHGRVQASIQPRGLRVLIAELLSPEPGKRPCASATLGRLEYLRAAPLRRARSAALAILLAGISIIAVVTLLAYSRAERLRVEAVAARDQAESTTQFLHDLLGRAAPDALGPKANMRDLLDAAPRLIEQRFANRPADKLRAIVLLADLEADFNNDQQAAKLSEDAALAAAQILPESDQALLLKAQSLRRRAIAGPTQAALEQAQALLTQAIQTQRSHSLIAELEVALAEVEFRSQLERANPVVAERMLQRLKRALDEPVLLGVRTEAEALRRLSSVLIERGDLAEGVAVGDRSVARAELHFGRDHAISALNRRVLGWSLLANGESKKAEVLFNTNLHLHEAKLGRRSAAVVDDLMGLSYALSYQKRDREALKLAEETWALANSLYEPAVRTTIDAGITLALAQKRNNSQRSSGQTLELLRQRLVQHRGKENRQYILVTRELAVLRHEQGEVKASRDLYRECADITARVLGANHSITLDCQTRAL
jgi:serine/threonine protein kinase